MRRPIRPNIILITIDALRPDHLGCYGYKMNTSPNIDKFSKEGVIFTQAISQGPATVYSLPSLMTSAYPGTIKVKKWGDYINESIFTLAQILKSNGFWTGCICAQDFFISLLGLNRGFDTLSTGVDLKAEQVTKKAILWIEKNKKKSFFLWLHYFDPHEPYRPPNYIKIDTGHTHEENYDKQVPILKNRPVDTDVYGGLGGIPDYAIVDGRREQGYYVSLYDREIKYTDEQIGLLLDELKKLSLYNNALIIITADHGESLGEHNLYFTHGTFLYDVVVRVPLIIKYGKLFSNSQIINKQVRLLDIMPTILRILHIRLNWKIEGFNLLPLIFKENKTPELYAFSEYDEMQSIRTPEWKLIYHSRDKRYELYDLINDPKELSNLVVIEKKQFKFLKAKLESWMHRLKPNIKPSSRPLDGTTKAKLKSLGYVQ